MVGDGRCLSSVRGWRVESLSGRVWERGWRAKSILAGEQGPLCGWRELARHHIVFGRGRIRSNHMYDVEVEVATWRKVSELDSTLHTDFDGVQGSGANLCQQSHEHGMTMTMRTGRRLPMLSPTPIIISY